MPRKLRTAVAQLGPIHLTDSRAAFALDRFGHKRCRGCGDGAALAFESQILDASRSGAIEGVVLRYGLFYGPENPSTVQMIAVVRRRWMPVIRGDQGLLPYIHVDDAARATIATTDRNATMYGTLMMLTATQVSITPTITRSP